MSAKITLGKDHLKAIHNPSTGNVFYVIGANHGLICGLRTWTAQAKKSNHQTEFGFRIRVECDENSTITPVQFQDYVRGLFPDAKWTGASSAHLSIAGGAILNCPIWETEKLVGMFDQNDLGGRVFDMLLDQLRAFEFEFDREQFAEYLRDELLDHLGGGNAAPLPNAPSVILDFGAHKQQLKDGFDVTPPSVPGKALGHHAGAVDGDAHGQLPSGTHAEATAVTPSEPMEVDQLNAGIPAELKEKIMEVKASMEPGTVPESLTKALLKKSILTPKKVKD